MFILPDFNFANVANISQETFTYHYGKHYKTYIDNLNNLSKDLSTHNLVDIINSSQGPLFNNAAQVWNHTFYFLGLTPRRSNLKPDSNLSNQIDTQYGSFSNFKEAFFKEALNLFGSGWTWFALNKESKKLEIINTSNAVVIDFKKYVPLLICDVWEHAYYIDFRNARNKYLEAFWNVINWEFVENNYNTQSLVDVNEIVQPQISISNPHGSPGDYISS